MRPSADASSLRGLMVMIVEDEFLIAMDLEATLLRHDAVVIGPVATVMEALRLLETERPDLALLDVHLKDGLVTPVAEALRRRNIPYVIASAYSDSDFAGRDALANVPSIGKPAREKDLVTALNAARR